MVVTDLVNNGQYRNLFDALLDTLYFGHHLIQGLDKILNIKGRKELPGRKKISAQSTPF